MPKIDGETLRRSLEVGTRAGNYADKYGLFAKATPLSNVFSFLRQRLYDNSIGTYTTTRYARVREEAIFAAYTALRQRLPSIAVVEEPLTLDDIERVRRLSADEQRRSVLDLDRADVEALIKRDERRLDEWKAERIARRLQGPTPKQLGFLDVQAPPAPIPVAASVTPVAPPEPATAAANLRILPYAVIDTETANGIELQHNGVCQLGITRVEGDKRQRFVGLVNPGVPISEEATAIHGITDEDVRGLPTLDALLGTRGVRDLLAGAQPVAFNAVFDSSFVPIDAPWLCSYRLLRHLDAGQTAYSLYAACERYGIPLGQAHDAGADVDATVGLTEKLLAQYLERGGVDSLEALRAFAEAPINYEKIHFGKHVGASYDDLPDTYLQRILRQTVLGRDPDIRHTIDATLTRRNQPRIDNLRQRLAARAASLTIS